MANILPTVPFPGLTSTGTSITIPLTALAGLTAAEADPATGDGRKVVEALVRAASSNILALDAANRPVSLTIVVPNATGAGAPNRFTQQYQFSALVDAPVGTEAELVAEPA